MRLFSMIVPLSAIFPFAVTAPPIEFPPSWTPPLLLSKVTAPSTMLVGQATPSSPITTRFVLFDTWMAPRTVELWQKVKGALDVEVTAPVIFESTTDSSWPWAK